MKSTSRKKLPAQILPHGEIWPLKITGKSRFLPEKLGFTFFLNGQFLNPSPIDRAF
jgi:hypothetical protein